MGLIASVRLTDINGVVQPLPPSFVRDWSFEINDIGGCGQFELDLDQQINDPVYNIGVGVSWTVDFYFYNDVTGETYPAFRGIIDESPPTIDLGAPNTSYRGNGAMARIKGYQVGAVYAKPYTSDVAETFAWVATRYITQPLRIPFLRSYVQPTLGYPIERADFSTADCRQALDALTDASQGSVIWGFSFDSILPIPHDKFWALQKPSSVLRSDYIFGIGRHVRYIDQQTYTGDIVNAIYLTGAASKSPNLVYNPSFEVPVIPGSGLADNYLLNPSFESGNNGQWSVSGTTATVRKADANQGEGVRTGTWIGEVDVNGEILTQTVTLPATVNSGTPFLLVFYYSAESGTGLQNLRQFDVKLESLNLSNTVLETLIDPATNAAFHNVPAHSAWVFEEFRQQVALSVDGCAKLRLTFTHTGGSGTSDPDKQKQAVAIDDVFLYRADALEQDGWGSTFAGAGRGVIDWAYYVDPKLFSKLAYHGAYCIRCNLSGMPTGRQTTNTVYVQTNDAHWINVDTFVDYRFRAKFRSNDAGYNSIRLGVVFLKDDNTQESHWSSYQTMVGTGDWEDFFFDVTTNQHHKSARLVFEFSKNGTVDIDAVDFYNYLIESRSDFIPGENLEYYFRADNSVGAVLLTTVTGGDPQGLTDEALASSGLYNLREARIQADLSDIVAAKKFAIGYLNDNAIPRLEGKLILDPCDVFIRHVNPDTASGSNEMVADGWIRILGTSPQLPDQWPAVIKYSRRDDGYARCEIDLNNRRPDLALIINKVTGGQVSGAPISSGGSAQTYNSVSGGATDLSAGSITAWVAEPPITTKSGGGAFDALSDRTGPVCTITLSGTPRVVMLFRSEAFLVPVDQYTVSGSVITLLDGAKPLSDEVITAYWMS